MVLGLRSRKKRGASVQIDYVVNVVEIKPWPPSPSLPSVQSVLLQWQNSEKNSGSFLTVAGESSIVFNESFVLPLTLQPDKKSREKFQKNLLEFSLYEPRRDKGTREQLLGTAMLNLSDYGVIEEIVTIAASLNCKKSSKNSPQPVLYIRIEPLDKGSSKSSPTVRSSRTSLDQQDGQESLADVDGDDLEIASFTDDDLSSHSSHTAASSVPGAAKASPSHSDKNAQEPINGTKGQNVQQSYSNGISPLLSPVVKSDKEHQNGRISTISPENSIASNSSLLSYLGVNEVPETQKNLRPTAEETPKENNRDIVRDELVDEKFPTDQGTNSAAPVLSNIGVDCMDVDGKKEQQSSEKEDKSSTLSSEYKSVDKLPRGGFGRIGTMGSTSHIGKMPGFETSNGRLKHVKSQLYESSTGRNNGYYFRSGNDDAAEMATTADIIRRDVGNRARSSQPLRNKKEIGERGPDNNGKSTVAFKNEGKNQSSLQKVQSDSRIQMLEDELRETATLEIGLYSVVAEHGSSVNKVHAPARRLSRFYLHACKEKSQAKSASAARAVISGLVLVSKACGNDVPRLTFWLSNTIMLRAIVSQAAGEIRISGRRHVGNQTNSSVDAIDQNKSEEGDEWEDVETFMFALEKTESWVFSRIVESIWWQTLTPHMQTTVAKGSSSKKTNKVRYGLGNQEQGNFSIELWKKAFKDACERLCPIRAGGHECGCLPVIARLVMEQLVSRLDVAMFNAILRESSEEMPTDPVSDPISDSRVLPIPAGKLSFGAGAQLKNAIGNWSRWLSDLFGIEDSESAEDNIDDKGPYSFKAFLLLNALSDLMMLPLEMLTDVSTRKEVCPLLGPMLIKKVLVNYVPDEFCPKPIPRSVVDALDYEVS
ncbi:OLC1v1028697C8 [Oldenlandia corymbosa var. corymbosa]|uniref:OLC1v1028697C8 n=1 Tax=Oldenlandia corymbosa var. corymbosa TaxID=529605 RepID=A0AAV1CE29_OLDCO|nr:OLC1v1028697C8 [Oldenlandia corymbosa var. corymbosa]